MPEGITRADLAPPQKIITAARAVLGAVDFDPYSTPKINEMVMAAKFNNRLTMTLDDVCAGDWQIRGEKRVFLSPPAMAIISRRLLNKAFREYRAGRVEQLLVVLSHNETMTKCPWIWDYPVCIPFKRIRPTYWDDEVEMFRPISPSDWSLVFYLPPVGNPMDQEARLSRFNTMFCEFGRVVINERSGEGDWEKPWEYAHKRPYNYRD